jgi:hypothetical protein
MAVGREGGKEVIYKGDWLLWLYRQRNPSTSQPRQPEMPVTSMNSSPQASEPGNEVPLKLRPKTWETKGILGQDPEFKR